jgi:glycosyltransferase involved in cell wall biosynthesis
VADAQVTTPTRPYGGFEDRPDHPPGVAAADRRVLPLRILQIHTYYRQSGGEDHVVHTDEQLLRQAGHDVHTYRVGNPDDGTAAAAFALAAWNGRAARQIRKYAEQVQPDLIHVHNTWFALSPAVFASLGQLGVPVVLTLHNYRLICAAATLFRDGAPCHDCLGTHPWHAVPHRCYRDSVLASTVAAGTIAVHQRRETWHRDVSTFIAPSDFARERFIEGGLPGDRIVVKLHSVADPGSRRTPPSASRTVLFVGRLAEEKGIATLLEAWRRQPHPGLELTVVGTGPLEAELRRTAPEGVRFLGAQPHEVVLSLMHDSRALVFPSLSYEGARPLTPIEASAAGLPVLLSDVGSMTEMFSPGADEMLVPPGDVAALGAGLARLDDDALVDRFGAHTRRTFEANHQHDIAVERLEQIYRSIL